MLVVITIPFKKYRYNAQSLALGYVFRSHLSASPTLIHKHPSITFYMTFVHPTDVDPEVLQQTASCSSSSFPTLEHIPQMLAMCSEKWICDFLFTTDPAHIAALTSPILRQNAFACHASLLHFDLLSAHSYPLHAYLNGALVLIPAFSASHVSVGFGIEEKVFGAIEIPDTPSTLFAHFDSQATTKMNGQFRYVRNDRTGDTIFVFGLPEYDLCRIEFIQHKSPALRQRSIVTLNHSRVLQSIRAHGGVLKIEEVLPAVTFLRTVFEFRSCPHCGAVPQVPCTCSLELAIAKHPFDFRNNSSHLRSHLGKFQGSIKDAYYSEGNLIKQRLLGSYMELKIIDNLNFINRVINQAIGAYPDEAQRISEVSWITATPVMSTDIYDEKSQASHFGHSCERKNREKSLFSEDYVQQSDSTESETLISGNSLNVILDHMNIISGEAWDDTSHDSMAGFLGNRPSNSCNIDNLPHAMDIEGWDPLRTEKHISE